MSTGAPKQQHRSFANIGKEVITGLQVINKITTFECEQPMADFMSDCFKRASKKEMIHIPAEEIELFKLNNTDYLYWKQVDDVWTCFSSDQTVDNKTLEDIKKGYDTFLAKKKISPSPKGEEQAGGVDSEDCKAIIASMAVIGAAAGAVMGAFVFGFGAGIGAGLGSIGGAYAGVHMCSPTDGITGATLGWAGGGAKKMKSTGLKIKVPGFGLKTIYTPHGKKTKYIKFMDLQNNGERTPRYEPLKTNKLTYSK
jgi:hypothetical protein